MRRRTLLRQTGTLAAGLSLFGTRSGAAAEGDSSRAGAPPPARVDTLVPDTPHATPVFAVRGDESGPTAMVVGGVHGDEPSGFRAATAITRWGFDRGEVFVVPHANEVAIRRDTREGTNGDLNRQFPSGDTPETPLARAIWGAVERYDPDVVVDLHESKGLYGTHQEFVGQAIFPTDVAPAPENARATARAVDRDVVPWYMPFHRFERGNLLDGSRPMLIHKVAADLERPGYIVELTKYLLDVETRTEWSKRVAAGLLARHGIHRRPVDETAGDTASTRGSEGGSA